MHPNPSFRKTATADALAFATERGFGVLAVNGPEGPICAHVPFTLHDDGALLRAHLMRSNPVFRVLRDEEVPALMTVSGPDAYISPDWYGIADQVPTWNYLAVTLRGSLNALPDSALRDVLDGLSDEFEARLAPKARWQMDKMTPSTRTRMMRMIAPVEMSVTVVESTYKLGQNKPGSARHAAAKALQSSGIGQEVAVLATIMQGVGRDS